MLLKKEKFKSSVGKDMVTEYYGIMKNDGNIVVKGTVTKSFAPIKDVDETVAEPTDTEKIMQVMTDSELNNFVIQQNQELLAQQMADIELMLLGGDR